MGAAIGEWQRGPVIGRGASATVSIAIDRRTGGLFAVKSVDVARAGLLRREQSVLSALSSPYVVSCLGGGVSADGSGRRARCYDLFLEYAPGGSLADEIARRGGGRCGGLAEGVIRSRAADVLRGLAHVHAAGVAHCDVKARNVLLRADGRAMLADFGCARRAAGGDGDGDFDGGRVIPRGTPMFMSPEAARGEAQGPAADVWALGCTVIEMATGGGPPWGRGRLKFADPVAVLHHVAHSGDVPQVPSWLSDEAKDFLSRCLVRDPARRWSAEQLLGHPFVVGVGSAKAAAPVELPQVSPRSALDVDQAFWDDDCEEEEDCSDSDESDTTAAAAAAASLTPADRVRALASAASLTPADRVRALASDDDVAADWTWSGERWITVSSIGDDDTASSVAGVVSEERIGGGGGGEHVLVDADASSRGHEQVSSAVHGDASCSGGDSDSSSSRCNSVVSSGSNSDSRCSNFEVNNNDAGLVTFRPRWQPFIHTLQQRAASFLPFGGASLSSRGFSSVAAAVVVVVTPVVERRVEHVEIPISAIPSPRKSSSERYEKNSDTV